MIGRDVPVTAGSQREAGVGRQGAAPGDPQGVQLRRVAQRSAGFEAQTSALAPLANWGRPAPDGGLAGGILAVQRKPVPGGASTATAPADDQGDAAPAVAPKTAVGSSALEAFRELLHKPKVKDAPAMAAWDEVDDKAACDEATVALAIRQLGSANANRVRVESGKGFGGGIADAILASKGAWKDALGSQMEAIITSTGGTPEARLRPLFDNPIKHYKPELPTTLSCGTVLDVGKKVEVTLSDLGWQRFTTHYFKQAPPRFRWKASVDETVFGQRSVTPENDTGRLVTATFDLTPTKIGKTDITVDLESYDDAKARGRAQVGVFGRTSRRYQVEVLDATKDPDAYFEARFKARFADIVDNASVFEKERKTKGALAKLFSPVQRKQLIDFCDTLIVPKGLFMGTSSNPASGPQRMLISAHILTYGKLDLSGQGEDPQKWRAMSCNGFASGVQVYAGINPGYGRFTGASTSEKAIAPTGEKSFGSGAPSVDPESNNDPKNPKEKGRRVNKKMMTFKKLVHTLRPGDWLYLDNGNPQGHSVIFVDWIGGKPEAKGDEGSARCRTFDQMSVSEGGAQHEFRLGYPSEGGVVGVYAITHARDAQPAATEAELLSFDLGRALKANRHSLSGLDTAAVRKKLHGLVSGRVAGIASVIRGGDMSRSVRGVGFTDAQKKLVDGILIGGSDDEVEIARLVALGQKLAVLQAQDGDPTPDGLLTTNLRGPKAGKSHLYWEAPFPGWRRISSLKKHSK